MNPPALSPLPNQSPRRPRLNYRPGDLVTPVHGYPILYEIVCLETDGLVRVRGLDWPTGYTVVLGAQEVRHVTGILSP